MRTTNSIDKLNQEKEEKVQSLQSTSLTIAEDGMEHIMGMLTNLYPNSVLAIFREYVSNGYDSHIKAGILGKKPIQVEILGKEEKRYVTVEGKTLPNENTFMVRDFGVGMSSDDIMNTYSKYGSSTKGDNNEEIGGFGVGAKSALSISDRFDVVSIKDGIEVKFFIRKETNGIGKLYIVSEEKTKKPNGVTVSVPISNDTLTKMHEIARGEFFAAWKPNSITVNGMTPRSLGKLYDTDRFVELRSGEQTLGWATINSGKYLHYEFSTYRGSAYFIGGIPYKRLMIPLSKDEAYIQSKANATIILNIPIGMVKLTPDRENIQDTEQSRKVIRDLWDGAHKVLAPALRTKLNSLEPKEAYDFMAWNLPAMEKEEISLTSWDSYAPYGHTKDDFNALPKIAYRGGVLPYQIDLTDTYQTVIKGFNSKSATAFEDTDIHFSNDKFPIISAYTREQAGSSTYRPTRQLRRGTRNVHFPIFVYGRSKDPKVETRLGLTRNARSIGEKYNAGTKMFTIYHVDSDTPPPRIISDNILTFSYDQLLAEGKKWRSEKAALAREGKPAVVRAKAIHYAVQGDGFGKIETTLLTSEQIRNFTTPLVSIHQDSGYRNADFWKHLKTVISSVGWKNNTRSELSDINALANVFPDTMFLLIPKTRKEEPIKKLNNSTLTIDELWEREEKALSAQDREIGRTMATLMREDITRRLLDTRNMLSSLSPSTVKTALTRIDQNDILTRKIRVAQDSSPYSDKFFMGALASEKSKYGRMRKMGSIFQQYAINSHANEFLIAYDALALKIDEDFKGK